MADFLSQDEIDSLMDISAQGGDIENIQTTKSVEYVAYNFKRPNRISSEHIRTVTYLHDKMLRDLSGDLSSVIKKMVDINLLSIDQMTYSEFTMSLADETNFNLVSLAPSDGKMVIESNPQLSRMIIDYLMGAKKELEEGEEDIITELEINILNHFLSMLRTRLSQAWKPVSRMSFELMSQDSNPHNTMLVASGEIVILVVLEFSIEDQKGLLNLCYPKSYIESLLASGAMNRIMAETKVKKSRNEDINSLLAGSKVKCEAIMANTAFKVEDFLKLNQDDTIVFNQPIHTLKGTLTLNNKEKFQIDFGNSNNRKSVKLTSPVLTEHQETIHKLREISKKREELLESAKAEMLKVVGDVIDGEPKV
jgi:flagellar motor switch protein FliM